MIQVSTYELALLIAGFAFGSIFIIWILKYLGYGDHGRDRRKGSRRGRHDTRGRNRGLGGFIVLLFVISGIALVLKIQNTSFVNPPKVHLVTEVDSTIQAPLVTTPIQETSEPEAGEGLNQDIYMPQADGVPVNNDESNSAPVETIQKFYIRVCVLSQLENVDPACQKLIKKGLEVSTLEKDAGIAVFVGPYDSKSKADQVNTNKKLGGVVEEY